MEMELSTKFMDEVAEAFEHWKSLKMAKAGQDPQVLMQIQVYPMEKWVVDLMAPAVYQLLQQKRVQETPYADRQASDAS